MEAKKPVTSLRIVRSGCCDDNNPVFIIWPVNLQIFSWLQKYYSLLNIKQRNVWPSDCNYSNGNANESCVGQLQVIQNEMLTVMDKDKFNESFLEKRQFEWINWIKKRFLKI